ncbi:2-amino-4-hydroxy-6-hydroxymethyldihydropteridine diphosphokinase [Phocaeicola coprophilus]|uniref:2-amino-4-hydroxy-6- hydroxymethyldihydropteridine diphosphokinase n=1 Tax=Phocaeicola coprophilus TaxID=387090 RepID=UPI00255C9B5B|nr:2-amino-4-hydroxy-6-hydroxymethyldihydropteridine diphosphokinase [Phocaeicola coprophilus]
MAEVYVSLGTNLGDKDNNLRTAVRLMQERIGKVISLSSFYETAPWGFQSEHSFLNAAACIETRLSPEQLLLVTQQIERELGRTQKSSGNAYKDRLIDIDLLMYDDLQIHADQLVLPHPLMTERRFVLEPLAEIAPEIIHPVTGKTIRELLELL